MAFDQELLSDGPMVLEWNTVRLQRSLIRDAAVPGTGVINLMSDLGSLCVYTVYAIWPGWSCQLGLCLRHGAWQILRRAASNNAYTTQTRRVIRQLNQTH